MGIVKSQMWMTATGTVPSHFIVFCWLPRLKEGYPEVTGERTQTLLDHVKEQGWPFYVRAMVPDRGDELFPAKFAFSQTCREGHGANSLQGRRSLRAHHAKISEADLSTHDPSTLGNDDDSDEIVWNIFDDESSTVGEES